MHTTLQCKTPSAIRLLALLHFCEYLKWCGRGQTLQLPSNEDRYLRFRLTYSHLTLVHSEDQGQDQGQGHFDHEYLVNGDRQEKRYYFLRYAL